MKKIILSAFLLLSLSCGSKKGDILNPLGNCGKLAEDYSFALTAYAQNQSTANCQNLFRTLDKYINGCSILTAEQKRDFNQSKADLKCE